MGKRTRKARTPPLSEKARIIHDLAIGTLMLTGVALIGYLSESYGKGSFGALQLSLFFAGCSWELYRITGAIQRVVKYVGGALILSALITLGSEKNDRSLSLDEMLFFWPFVFAVTFFVIVLATFQREYTVRLRETDTMLHTIAAWYLLLEFLSDVPSIPFFALLLLPFSIHSLWHAYSHRSLTTKDRLWLSVWSTMVMLVLGTVYLVGIFQRPLGEAFIHSSSALLVSYRALEWFLCGVAAAYIAQNFAMVFGYLPGKTRFFNAAYFREIKELSALHTERYESTQACKHRALLVSLTSITALALNSWFNLMNPFMAIWVLFALMTPVARGAPEAGTTREGS